MDKIILAILILFLIMALIEIIIVNYAFKNIILSPRKTKEQMFNLLTKRDVFDVNRYDTLKYEKVFIRSKDNLKLTGYYFNNFKKGRKVIVISHGYTASHLICLQYLDMFFEKGFNVLLIDARSHGKSEGKYVTYGLSEREDLKLWVNYIKQRIKGKPIIGLLGQSMGAAAVLMYEGKYDDVHFVIADCPYSNARDEIVYRMSKVVKGLTPLTYRILRRKVDNICSFDINKASPIDDIKNSKIPTLFIHGTSDQTIPYEMSEKMYKLKNGEKDRLLLVKGARHVEAYSKDKLLYEETVDEFIDNVLEDIED